MHEFPSPKKIDTVDPNRIKLLTDNITELRQYSENNITCRANQYNRKYKDKTADCTRLPFNKKSKEVQH